MRTTPLFVGFATAAMLTIGTCLVGCNQPYDLRVVETGEHELTVSDPTGDDQQTHDVAEDAKITLDGTAAELNQLEPGDAVDVKVESVDGKDVATEVDAKSTDPSNAVDDGQNATEPIEVDPTSPEQTTQPQGDDPDVPPDVVP